MKKFYQAIILLIILSIINSETVCEGSIPSTREECWNRFTDTERDAGFYCCYQSGKRDSTTHAECVMFGEDESTDDAKKLLKEQGYSDVVIDCNNNSYYLQVNILILLLILL